jgi:hypothetical protein
MMIGEEEAEVSVSRRVRRKRERGKRREWSGGEDRKNALRMGAGGWGLFTEGSHWG